MFPSAAFIPSFAAVMAETRWFEPLAAVVGVGVIGLLA